VGGTITSVESGVGIFFEPTLLTEATNDMSLLQTHSPSPILCCFCVTSDDDFLNSFNDSRFGAKVKIFTKEGSPK
jgi:malonate-semialdehyde dehydrogenase (acetylating)/methylmalonate-semialdehyde dehydrogenase